MIKRSNNEMFEIALAEYREEKRRCEKNRNIYDTAYHIYESEFKRGIETIESGNALDKARADLDASLKMYDILAHQALRYYESEEYHEVYNLDEVENFEEDFSPISTNKRKLVYSATTYLQLFLLQDLASEVFAEIKKDKELEGVRLELSLVY